MDFAILEDLKNYLNISDNDNDYLLQRLITSASQFISTYCQRDFELKQYTDRFNGNFSDYHVFSKYPVAEIISIVNNNGTITNNNYYIEDDFAINLEDTQFIGKCSIEYRAGFETIPDDIVQATIEIASYWFKKKDNIDLGSKNMSTQTVSYMVKELPDWIMIKLLRYKTKY